MYITYIYSYIQVTFVRYRKATYSHVGTPICVHALLDIFTLLHMRSTDVCFVCLFLMIAALYGSQQQ